MRNKIMANVQTTNKPSDLGFTNDFGEIFGRYKRRKKSVRQKYTTTIIKAKLSGTS
jgi:hypothetical protein